MLNTKCLTCLIAQILDGQLTDKYHEVQQRVDTKAKAVQEAKKKAERLRDEAKELLKDAQDKLQRLAGAQSYLCVFGDGQEEMCCLKNVWFLSS